jgi:diguanylate cyclase (GGDEF)-like protein
MTSAAKQVTSTGEFEAWAFGKEAPARRILVIDDNAAIHDDIRKVLALPESAATGEELARLGSELFGTPQEPSERDAHFMVDAAHQGEEGFEMVKASMSAGAPYMLAFVDARMPPGWNGIETISRLWSLDPDLQIVLCTAYSDQTWREISRQLHRLDRWLVLKKPFDTIEVLQAAHALTNKWLLSSRLRAEIENLESRVVERTKEIQEVNERLSTEINEKRAAEAELRHLATYDALTGLANRTLLRDRLDNAVARARRYKSELAVLLLDLNRFKEINDSLGHDAGDRLLRLVAKRLKTCARESDTVARLGGDEFAFVLPDLRTAEDAGIVADRVLRALAENVTLGDQQFVVGASIGIAVHGTHGRDSDELLRCADLAMYDAKSTGLAGYRYYVPEAASRLSERLLFRDEIKEAEARQELFLLYQPLIDLTTSEVIGFESLVRWRHPRYGVLPPVRFLSLAEELHLMPLIGRWVLTQACTQTVAWQRAGLRPVVMSVNFSAEEIEDPGVVDSVGAILQKTGLEPRYLEIELTETSAYRDHDRALANMAALRALGVRMALDDFGIGTSSLARLKTLPVDTLKIDRLFVSNITTDPRDQAIVAGLVSIARSLNLRAVAEGIETAEQLASLRELNWSVPVPVRCEVGQGYFFSKPMTDEAATNLLAEHSGTHPIAR